VSAFAVVAGLALVVVILIVKDVRRRHAEESLRLSESKYRATLAALPDAVLILDSLGSIRECHARDPAVLFGPHERALDRRLQDVLPAESAARIAGWIAGDADGHVAVVEYSREIGGVPHEFEVRLVREGCDEVVAIVRDVTDRKCFESALREREASLRDKSRADRSLAGQLIAAQEEERRRIARDLHDDLSQKLALLNIEIDTMAANGADRRRQERRFQGLSNLVAEIAKDVHDLSHELHPSKLGSLGLVAAIEGLCRDVSRRYGIAVGFRHDGGSSFSDEPASLHLYRIAQEALHNVVKHSAAKEALVELQIGPDALELRVVDDGCGFVPTAETREGLGLTSMRERVKIVGGQIAIQSTPGGGTRLGVHLPSRVDGRWPGGPGKAIADSSPAEIA
jgi:signal transduction histidine kinase